MTHRLNPEQLPELVDRLYRAAWAMCGSPHDAEDLVQETLVRVLSRPRTLRRRDQLPYLMQALRNTHLTAFRTASRRPRTTELPAEESSTMQSSMARPHIALEQRETLDAIAALPEDFRDALVAVDVVGLSYREAGRALGVPEATISTRLYRARQRLARTLTGEPTGHREATVAFPDYREMFGWRASGERSDDLDDRATRTVFYDRRGDRIAYTIVSGARLEWPPDWRQTRREGIELRSVERDGTTTVTWIRDGRTCVLSGTDVPRDELLALAAWNGEGTVSF